MRLGLALRLVGVGVGRVFGGWAFGDGLAEVAWPDPLPRDVLPRGVLPRGVLPRGELTRGELTGGVLTLGVLTLGVLPRGVLTRGVSTRGVLTRGVLTRGVLTRGVDDDLGFTLPEFVWFCGCPEGRGEVGDWLRIVGDVVRPLGVVVRGDVERGVTGGAAPVDGKRELGAVERSRPGRRFELSTDDGCERVSPEDALGNRVAGAALPVAGPPRPRDGLPGVRGLVAGLPGERLRFSTGGLVVDEPAG